MKLASYAIAAMTADAGSLPSCFTDLRRSRTAACVWPAARRDRSAPPVRCQSRLVPAATGKVVFMRVKEVGDLRHRAGCVSLFSAVLRCCTRCELPAQEFENHPLNRRVMVSLRRTLLLAAQQVKPPLVMVGQSYR
jgi:hypothetical protein